jgi:hypothetical protein
MLNTPDGSSPRGYSQISPGIDSKNDFSFTALNFLSASLIFLYTNSPYHTIFRVFILPVSTTTIVFIFGYSYFYDVINTIKLFVIIFLL